ncbi:YciI family protein [Citricoccus sp. NR2]|uniref:YciI family protein n=1 Tax=Citricoccus sp. NR2 TaxID=3004095 RepID=UPI0022DDF165|nr:YciI family protein [Citricoccus sp. NR2]WBL19487.1 YciI family protein [Citricoccus sp. NR2]
MPYFIETFDDPSRAHVRQEAYQAHLDFLAAQAELLLACGAKLDDEEQKTSGGVYLVDLETRAEAEAFIAKDPFYQHHLFATVNVTRWRKAYLDGANYLS